ncbi:hypothetical protein GPS45_04595 [Acinetobacter haemolyticus]|uniref:ATP-grasp domain-containing protein n=1 Tax=Acinetobacter haemolyticus TaxID=29430 RepID=UPI00137314BA|nr:hypothetical protein [Acinetobacter haemolyticus]NAR88833.1 hypothetical protein [Acinetobacter haemolyticus]
MSIFILTLPDGSFNNAGQSWKKIDLKKIISELDFPVETISFDNLDNINFNSNDILIYTSSENSVIRQFIKNKLFYIKDRCNLIPTYELLMAHEDKGFQEVMKKEKKFGNLKGNYIFDFDNHQFTCPKVLKTSQGAGSSGVFLIKNNSDLNSIKHKFFEPDLKRKVIRLQRKFKLSPEEYQIYSNKYKKFNLFVEQEFISNLTCDYKVLVFGDRYFVLKRNVRKNDFRASGSGDFEFVDPPVEVLDFAKEIADILKNPYFSLDIAQSDQGCHLIEFQATNFGPYTLLNAPVRYIKVENSWRQEKNCRDLESNYAYALNFFVKKICLTVIDSSK